jgi:AcrR family transcriptional regulator
LSDDDRPVVGLRERKKAKTKSAIQQHALRLFHEQGYHSTTVEQIADAAEVSPSTFFRYFPSKEEVVLYDATDPLLLDSLRSQPAELTAIQALRASMREVFGALPSQELELQQERDRLIRAVPELRARMLDEFVKTLHVFADALAERTGRRPDDPAVRTLAAAVIGVGIGVWYTAGDHAVPQDYMTALDTGLDLLERGVRL